MTLTVASNMPRGTPEKNSLRSVPDSILFTVAALLQCSCGLAARCTRMGENLSFRNTSGYILLLTLAFVPGMVSGEVRLVPTREIVSFSAMPEPLSVKALIQSSLIASGVESDRIEGYTGRYLDISRKAAATATGNDMADSEALLKWMHDNYLTRYVETQTRMDILLDTGEYNCVSSAVFYLILTRSIGLEIRGVVTRDHAFCRLPNIGNGIDVETTNYYGFDPGSRQEILDLVEGRIGFAYVPPSNYKQRRDINHKELISLIFQNRIAFLHQSNNWQPAVGLALDQWTLSGTDTAREDFIQSLNNAAAESDNHNNNEEALVMLSKAARLLGAGHGLEKSAKILFSNQLTRHGRAHEFDDALNFIEDSRFTALLPPSYVKEKYNEVRKWILEDEIKNSPFSEAAASVDSALNDGIITLDRWSELSLYIWSTEANRLSAGKNWIEGLKFLRNAPPELAGIPQWKRMLDSFEQSTAAAFHNQFVRSYRKKEFDQARAYILEGLSILPQNALLLKDFESLNRIMKQ